MGQPHFTPGNTSNFLPPTFFDRILKIEYRYVRDAKSDRYTTKYKIKSTGKYVFIAVYF